MIAWYHYQYHSRGIVNSAKPRNYLTIKLAGLFWDRTIVVAIDIGIV